ncbi:MAG: hypothetical protein DMG08_08480 [Acidobacteria bacterium]|nr:MAG: hypothetical protein DMG08_08480 [Acidobacteriota bacterium]
MAGKRPRSTALGLSATAAVRVGHAVGRGDAPRARRSAAAALACGAIFMLFAATFFLVLPRMLARLYTRDPLVTGIAVRLPPIAGFFQVFDGLQVVAAGVLRGLGDTRVPMLISLLGFWCAGESAPRLWNRRRSRRTLVGLCYRTRLGCRAFAGPRAGTSPALPRASCHRCARRRRETGKLVTSSVFMDSRRAFDLRRELPACLWRAARPS